MRFWGLASTVTRHDKTSSETPSPSTLTTGAFNPLWELPLGRTFMRIGSYALLNDNSLLLSGNFHPKMMDTASVGGFYVDHLQRVTGFSKSVRLLMNSSFTLRR
ncbi:hypothetical protein CEXT_503961 [Caerostris extrusa]|uniref:Uncharacterized protein n=1 Tax=Caerostris extrusa TaxID=172846 RepID=A0AAV4S9T9_CAEEX|nr:hypothetical protein CEXT_503961 [Caerostris extrusa]